MTDKERLEEAKLMAEMLRVETRLPHDFPFDLVDWLIKQAERVQELEEENNQLNNEMEGLFQKLEDREPYYSMKCLGLEQQNKQYREAIEVAIHNMAASDNLGVKFALGILEQALEESE